MDSGDPAALTDGLAERGVEAGVVDLDPKELIRGEGDTWLPWDLIASVQAATTRMRRFRFTIDTVDGDSHTLRTTMHSHDSGDTVPAIAYFLEDRVVG